MLSLVEHEKSLISLMLGQNMVPFQRSVYVENFHIGFFIVSELVVRKTSFCICENKGADQTAQLISTFVFAT